MHIVVTIPANKIIKNSSPAAQSGLEMKSLFKILSMTVACTSTPGKKISVGVVRMSFNPAAVVPTKTILSLNVFIEAMMILPMMDKFYFYTP